MKSTRALTLCLSALLVFSWMGTGCKKTDQPAKTYTPEQQAQAAAKLAAADAHDGTTDQVVGDCLMCGLRMSGKPAHASTYEGVSLHFCKAACKRYFDQDPVGSLLKVEIEE
jgi:YHS domain-containing protein